MTGQPLPQPVVVRPRTRPRRRRPSPRDGERRAGCLFTLPMLLVLGVFLAVPVLMALYVSLTSWDGSGSPFVRDNAPLVGLANYRAILAGEGLVGRDFMTSVGNTLWYVLLVVPLQTACALGLALLLHSRALRGHRWLRTAFYLPSVTSSVAITTVFVFLFSGSGVVNALLDLVGIDGPGWTSDPDGVLHLLLGRLGVHEPGWGGAEVLGRTVWDWLSGPSVAMLVLVLLAVWTTTGTFMLIFLAALQDLPAELDDAAAIDGATGWRRLRWVTLPQLRPTTYLVATLGLISTWQVFDQVYATGGGAPAKTLLTPAYLSYQVSFQQGAFGPGAAMAFVLFVVIVVLTWLQRRLMSRRWPR